ncbi:putative sulfoacetate transporter SauU [Aquicella siphonis]|uniref:Lysosomal dipeptide transporter MFSD1 n=1 Tax=Aquicella siphonis TaxID=254247 RepID=A0A5E4PI68_9COXI|nr:MFS transporter [Aquicella siphonis]VVC76046.1 putative sulfoacetate transporter SauU [Aquicella siphonis]
MMADNRGMSLPMFRSAYPWLIVCCGMLFYCYNYFLRVSPSVMQNELSQTFHITATQFGTLAGFYYWAYTPMQIPAGMIYDKFGVRIVLCAACLLAVFGLSIFIASDDFATAGLGRFMIGLGTAFAYIGTLKLASIWLPPNRFATVAGLTTAIGMTSGALAQKYLTKVVELIGYQQALHSAVIAGILLSVVIIVLVRNRPKSQIAFAANEMQNPIDLKQLLAALRTIFTNRQMWLIGIIGCLLYLPSSVFLDLWGIPYLKAVYQLKPEEAVAISNYTFYGWIISGPLIGAFSDRIKRRRFPLTFTGFFAALLLCIVFYLPNLTLSSLYGIFFMIGFCCGAHPLCFALGKENNPLQISGTAVAVTNMLIMAGGAIFQPVVGKLLDLHTTSPIGADGLPVYSSSDYTFALSIIPIGVALGIFLSVFLKETYCSSPAEEAEDTALKPDSILEPEVEPAK